MRFEFVASTELSEHVIIRDESDAPIATVWMDDETENDLPFEVLRAARVCIAVRSHELRRKWAKKFANYFLATDERRKERAYGKLPEESQLYLEENAYTPSLESCQQLAAAVVEQAWNDLISKEKDAERESALEFLTSILWEDCIWSALLPNLDREALIDAVERRKRESPKSVSDQK